MEFHYYEEHLCNSSDTFKSSSITFIDLQEETAKLDYVTTVIKGKWGEEYVIVNNDGLILQQCKVGSYLYSYRVIYRSN